MSNQLSSDSEKAPQAEQNYLHYYGLKSDPFAGESDFQFETAFLQKTLKLFNHLSSFSQKLIALTGEKGLGKTTVLEEFVRQRSEQDRICYMLSLELDTPKQVLREISDEFGVRLDESADTKQILSSLDTFFEESVQDAERYIIVLDDAHLLDASVLEVIAWLALKHSVSLHVLLSGEPALHDRLRRLAVLKQHEKLLYHHQLVRFNLEDTKAFLKSLFEHHSDQSESPFSEADGLLIYQQSWGIPARIKHSARILLEQGVDRLLTSRKSARWKITLGMLALVVLVAGSVTYYWDDYGLTEKLADAGEVEPKKMTVRRIERQSPANAGMGVSGLSESSGVSSSVVEQDIRSLELEETEELIDAQSAFSLDEKSGTVEQQRAQDKLVVSEAINDNVEDELQQTDIVEKAESEPEIELAEMSPSETVPEPDSPEEKAEAELSESNILYTASEQALLDFNGREFTIQLFGTKEEKNMRTIMAGLPPDEKYRYIQTEHNGGPWFVLVYGNFAERKQAMLAAAGLPQQLNPKAAWVRRISGVQQAILSRK